MTSVPPSVNHCYVNYAGGGRRGRKLSEAAKNWKLMTFYAAKAAARSHGWEMPEAGEKIVLEVYAFWPDARRHDMNNIHKLLCDGLEGVLYADDCCVLVRDMDYCVDRKAPRLECIVYQKDEYE